jgi:hypothetical protein
VCRTAGHRRVGVKALAYLQSFDKRGRPSIVDALLHKYATIRKGLTDTQVDHLRADEAKMHNYELKSAVSLLYVRAHNLRQGVDRAKADFKAPGVARNKRVVIRVRL